MWCIFRYLLDLQTLLLQTPSRCPLLAPPPQVVLPSHLQLLPPHLLQELLLHHQLWPPSHHQQWPPSHHLQWPPSQHLQWPPSQHPSLLHYSFQLLEIMKNILREMELTNMNQRPRI